MTHNTSKDEEYSLSMLSQMVHAYWDKGISILYSQEDFSTDWEDEFLEKIQTIAEKVRILEPQDYQDYLEMLSIHDPDSYFLLAEED